MNNLCDFLYLDTIRLHSFVSQIHGGLVSEINETIRKHGGLSAGVEVGLPPLSGKMGVSKDKGDERQQTVLLTDQAYFGVLHTHLATESELIDITASSLRTRQELYQGQFIEMVGIAEPPAVEHWITRVRSLVDFIDRNLKLLSQPQSKDKRRPTQTLSRQQMTLFKETVSFLEDYTRIARKDPGKQFVHVTHEKQEYSIWCGLLPDFIAVPLEATLPTEVHVFGRIEKPLKEDEIYKIVDFAQFNQPADVGKLLDALNALGPLIGQRVITEKDLQAQYPDVFITPIAIYR